MDPLPLVLAVGFCIALVCILVFVSVRQMFTRAVLRLIDALESARRGEQDAVSHAELPELLRPLSREIVRVSESLMRARVVASEEARLRMEKLDSPWTSARLAEFAKATLRNRRLVLVSNREPYLHYHDQADAQRIRWMVPAGGAVTALESVMEACGGTWIAFGSGDADREVVGPDDTVAVPPDHPTYMLRRVWLTPEEVAGYYDGFSNEALWPLFNQVHVRPRFRAEDWLAYRTVNGTFAKTVLHEIEGADQPLVLIQDYHLALLPALVKRARPDALVSIFWHVPWPSSAAFSICPWRHEILEGLLGADLIGFHTQQYCNDFLDTVANELEARIDLERATVTSAAHTTSIRPFPISVAFPGEAEPLAPAAPDTAARFGVSTTSFGLGVDRLDYTKGLMERFKALEVLFERYPEWVGAFTFLQIAAPTRTGVARYREYAEEVAKEAERINARFGTDVWWPIVLLRRNVPREELIPLYQSARVCLVTSLHDGMNLVAKEYVAARSDEGGALVLSQFAGAAHDLTGAFIVNPYSAESVADALNDALALSPAGQYRRMKMMRASVADYNVFRWAAELIKALTRLG